MINGLCHSGSWGSLGNLGGWGWVGMILGLVFWVGLLVVLALLVVLTIRRAWASAAKASHAVRQSNTGSENTAKEILQADYARGEITREQYEIRKQDIRQT